MSENKEPANSVKVFKRASSRLITMAGGQKTTIKPGDEIKDEYDVLQVERSSVRRAISNREKKWDELSVSRTDLLPLETEEHLIKNYEAKLSALDEKMRELLVLPPSEGLIQERNAWEDRVGEYQIKLSKGYGKISWLRKELMKVEAATENLAKGAANSSQAPAIRNEVTVRQEPKIPKFAGDPKKFRDWIQTFETAVGTYPTKLEKPNKLRDVLQGAAYKAISVIELNGENYDEAFKIIHEEFGSVFSTLTL